MMRGPDLKQVLESPHLQFDQATTKLIDKDLEKAEKFLKEVPDQKDYLNKVNTAYLSMYCTTQALLHSIHYKASGFRAVVTVLEEYFVAKGILEKSHVEHLLKSQKVEGTVDENIAAAEEYLNSVKKILKKDSGEKVA